MQRSGAPLIRGSKLLAPLASLRSCRRSALQRMVKSIKLKSLVEQSDIIVVAVVTKVEADPMIVARPKGIPALEGGDCSCHRVLERSPCARGPVLLRQPNPVTLRGRKREKR